MKQMILGAVAGFALATGLAAHAWAFTPAVIYDETGKFDKSFNEAAFNGAQQYRRETGNAFLEFEPTSDSARAAALRDAAAKADMVVAVGFRWGDLLSEVASANPDRKFVIIDAVVDQPNVQSITFSEHEGSYLVGVLAGLATETGTVGFVGGMDLPLIHKFRVGYEEGVHAVRPDATILAEMTGDTPAAFNDPFLGGEIAYEQIDGGADVLFAAAGATGLGVYETAAAEGKLAIGVDSNQNYLFPGSMLTSMVKRVDLAVKNAMAEGLAGTWQPGHKVLGLAEGGVDAAIDEHNRPLITPEMEETLQAAKADIIAGRVTVTDYTE